MGYQIEYHLQTMKIKNINKKHPVLRYMLAVIVFLIVASCIHYGSAVIELDISSGEILSRLEVPVPKTSCCCFAGENLDELIITTASIEGDAEKYPNAGYLFKKKLEVKGKRIYRYK